MFFKKTKRAFGLFFILALTFSLSGYHLPFFKEIQKTEAKQAPEKIIYAKTEGAHGVPDSVFFSLFSVNPDGSEQKTLTEISRTLDKPALEFFSYCYNYSTNNTKSLPKLQYAPENERYKIGVYYTDYQSGADLSSQAGASHKKFYDVEGNEVTSTFEHVKYFKDETETNGYLSPNGKYFAYTNKNNKAIIKDLEQGTQTEITPSELTQAKQDFGVKLSPGGEENDFPQPVGWSKDSSKLYLLGAISGTYIQEGLFVYNLAQKKITAAAKWSGDKTVSYILGEANIFPDLGKALLTAPDKSQESEPWPGAEIRIISVDLQTMQATEVSESELWINPYYNPTGTKIVAETMGGQDIPTDSFTTLGERFQSFGAVWSIKPEGGSAQKLVENAEFAGWSGDGKGIAYTSRNYDYTKTTKEGWYQATQEALYATSLGSQEKTQIYSENENYPTNLGMQYLGWSTEVSAIGEVEILDPNDPEDFSIIEENDIEDSFPPDTEVKEIITVVGPEATEQNIENVIEKIVDQKASANEELDGLRIKVHRQKKNGKKGSLLSTAIWAPDGDWSKIANTKDKSNYKIVITHHHPWLKWLLVSLGLLLLLIIILLIILLKRKKEKSQAQTPQVKSSYWWIIALVILGLVLASAGFYYYYYYFKKTKTSGSKKAAEKAQEQPSTTQKSEEGSEKITDGPFSVTIPDWDEDADLKKDNPTALAAVSDGKGASVIVRKDAILGTKDFKTSFEESEKLLTDLGAKIIKKSVLTDEAYLESEFINLKTGQEIYVWAKYLHIQKVVYSVIVHAPKDKKAEYQAQANEIINSATITKIFPPVIK